ncbi:MAG: eukaryotic-like serine/threonine-protein kinase [Myxococcales bacterium]|nr:eukaryotic-like serine/threonine-protein kinase [Myxococcales bacterium]
MIGQWFGNYRAVSLLGEGGMGAVYLAEHRSIGRRVAVKVLHRNLSLDPQLLARFLNEARTANAIRHPNIIEILDSGALADGMPYLVMELLEGESLAARIRRLGRLPVRSALRFAYQTASALGAAHAKGIVHRDLKPDNMFVVPDQEISDGERLKILDFGIAKLQEGGAGGSVKTRTGAVMGTPLYMSPEQCRGVREIDHRSDIYSMGIILYEMVSGRPPFVSEGFGDLVNMHLNMPVPSLSAAVPEVSAKLEALIMRSLAKNPDDRFADMAAVREALKAVPGGALATATSFPDNGSLVPPPGSTARMESSPASAPGAATTQTTSSSSVGEIAATLPPQRRRATTVAVVIALAIGAAGVVGALAVYGGKATSPPAETAAPAVAAPPPAASTPSPPTPPPSTAPIIATVTVSSQPAGARVLNLADGTVLGTTPVALTRKAGDLLGVKVELKGYRSASRQVAVTGDQEMSFVLERQEAAHEPPRPPRHKTTNRADEEPAKL